MSLVSVTISGPPGSGKSALAQLLADRLRVLRVPVTLDQADLDAELSLRAQGDRIEELLLADLTVRIAQRTERRRG